MKNKKNLSFFISHFSSWSGFTLIESVLYIAIFSSLIIIFSSIFSAILDIQKESEATSSVSQDSQFILLKLTNDIRNADSVNVPLALGEQANNLQITIDSVNYNYSLDNGLLKLGEDALNGFDTKINAITFQKIGNPSGKETILISFTLESKTKRRGGYETKTFETAAGLR